MKKASSKAKSTRSRMKVFFSAEKRDCLKIQDVCNIRHTCFETSMDAMKSLSKLYVSNKDYQKSIYEPGHEKTNILHKQNQRGRSASR